jgi:hypothetical protein
MGIVVRFPRRGHVRASAASPACTIPQSDDGASRSRARKASSKTKNVSAGIEPRLRQLDTACAGRPTKRATAAVPPRASITASTVSSGASGIMVDPDIYTDRVHDKPIHLVCSPELGISAPSEGMAKRLLHPRSVEAIRIRLISLRMAIGPNAKRFAERAGIAPNTWSNYENEEGRRISLEEAQKLVDTYSVTLDWVFDGKAARMPGDLLDQIRAKEPDAIEKAA